MFITDELSPFRSGLPEAASKRGRVDACLAFLADKRLSDRCPVLPLFLATLRDRYREGDALRDELDVLAQRVQAALGQPSSVSPPAGVLTRGHGTASPPEPTEIRARYALLIGVRDYENAAYRSLPHTVHDVIELEKALSEAGYTTRVLHSDQPDVNLKPTRNHIWDSLENLAGQTGPGDLLLVYFGGHGDLREEAAYLVPCDGGKFSLHRTAVDLDDFKQTLAAAGAQAKVLILDACHSGIGRDAAGMDEAFARHVYLEATGTATLASCRKGEVAYEHHESSHGAFTHYLLAGLRGAAIQERSGFVSFNGLSNYVTATVKKWAIGQGLQQWPNATTELVGDPPLIQPPNHPVPRSPEHSTPPNPFTDTLAIRDPVRFIGRETHLRRLMRVLRGGSVALVGDRKIGKSSLLHRLAHSLRQEPGQVVVFWDFFDLGDVKHLLMAANKALGAEGEKWDHFKRAVRGRRMVLLLDEFDVAPERGFDLDHLRQCRALCQVERGLRLVTASRTLPREIFPDPGAGSWPYDFLGVQPLGPFTPDEACRLLAHPWAPDALSFEDATRDELIALSGCHPYRLQRAAYHRYEALCDAAYDWRTSYELDLEALG